MFSKVALVGGFIGYYSSGLVVFLFGYAGYVNEEVLVRVIGVVVV